MQENIKTSQNSQEKLGQNDQVQEMTINPEGKNGTVGVNKSNNLLKYFLLIIFTTLLIFLSPISFSNLTHCRCGGCCVGCPGDCNTIGFPFALYYWGINGLSSEIVRQISIYGLFIDFLFWMIIVFLILKLIKMKTKKENKYLKTLLVLILALLFVGFGGFGTYYFMVFGGGTKMEVSCTSEAKICPDRSSVGRTGPNCEFAPCPDSNNINSENTTETADWKTYRNDEFGFEFKYPSYFTPIVTDVCQEKYSACSDNYKSINISRNDYGNCGFMLRFYKNIQNLNVKDWVAFSIAEAKKEMVDHPLFSQIPDPESILIEQEMNTNNEIYYFTGKSRWPTYSFRLVRIDGWIIAFQDGINCNVYGSEYGPSLSKSDDTTMISSFKFFDKK